MKFSFICPVNDEQAFNTNVRKTLKTQKLQNFEIIKINTQRMRFESAAEALNYGAAKANGEYLVFLHQDIVISKADFTEKLFQAVEHEHFIIAGIAGAIRTNKFWKSCTLSAGLHGRDKIPMGEMIDSSQAVESVDECFFVIPRRIFLERGFDEDNKTWHLYAVEYSLWANSIQRNSVMVMPIKVYHKSKGQSISKSYFKELHRLRDLYKKDVITTCGSWPYNYMAYRITTLLRYIKWFRK